MSIKHLDLIKKSFQLKDKDIDKIKKNENIDLENYNWDSIVVINLITLVSDKYNKNIKPENLQKVKTFKSLDNFLKRLISK
tara:strand:+ start:3860 stop:4102 length:243 start_codon:yes stop_codon:yes gene_type:complete